MNINDYHILNEHKALSNSELLELKGGDGALCWHCHCVSGVGEWYDKEDTQEEAEQEGEAFCDGPASCSFAMPIMCTGMD